MRTLMPLIAICLASLLGPAACPAQPDEPALEATPVLSNPAPVIARPAPERLVAIGDLHGDLSAAQAALRLAGAVDAGGHWVGGTLMVVQTGDVVDRGDDERAILDWFEVLEAEAAAAGGAFVMLNANHEVMAVNGELSGTTEGAMAAFAGVEDPARHEDALADVPGAARHRVAAFQPGAPYAMQLADNDVIAQVGDTLFVHGGVLPKHVERGLQLYNEEARAWMRGEGEPPAWRKERDSPVWCRDYSREPDETDCQKLAQVLEATGTERMVVGHTVQKEGMSSDCDGGIWRIDVGLAEHYGRDAVEVLEIRGDEVRVLRAPKGPTVVLWAWERPEDLRFADPTTTAVAYLASTATLRGDRVELRPRLQPLRLPEGMAVEAVVRVEADPRDPPALSAGQRNELAGAIVEAARAEGVRGVQIDFDATVAQRAFYAALLADVRAGLPEGAGLTMTALASWCLGDPWVEELPVDAAVPMLFEMGPDADGIRRQLGDGEDFGPEICRSAVGLATGEPVPGVPTGRRTYLFHETAWTAEALDTALEDPTP